MAVVLADRVELADRAAVDDDVVTADVDVDIDGLVDRAALRLTGAGRTEGVEPVVRAARGAAAAWACSTGVLSWVRAAFGSAETITMPDAIRAAAEPAATLALARAMPEVAG